jgi:hypothetical protein
MVALLEFETPTVALKVKESVPVVFASGVYTKAPVDGLVIVAIPLLPLLTMLYVNVALSGLLGISVTWTVVSSSVTTELEVAVGAAELVISPPPLPPPPPPPPQPETDVNMLNIITEARLRVSHNISVTRPRSRGLTVGPPRKSEK